MLTTATKVHEATPVGIKLWQSPNHEILVVHLDSFSIFNKTNLKRGMRIDCVNDVVCYSVSQAYQLLEDSVGVVELRTSAPGDPPVLVYDSSECSSDEEEEEEENTVDRKASESFVQAKEDTIKEIPYKSYLEALLYGGR